MVHTFSTYYQGSKRGLISEIWEPRIVPIYAAIRIGLPSAWKARLIGGIAK
jgi:hypothetical protein